MKGNEVNFLKEILKLYIIIYIATIMNCRTQIPVMDTENYYPLNKIDNENRFLSENDTIILKNFSKKLHLQNEIYNTKWFEQRIEYDLEGSMISPSILPLLSAEKKRIENIISEMSINEKIGQLFIPDLKDIDSGSYFTAVDTDLEKLITEFEPGGIIFFSANIISNEQIRNFISSLQSLSEIPLFIAVDQEGGRVSRLNNSTEMNVFDFPSHQILGAINNIDTTWTIGKLIGEELKNLGFNFDLAPVGDINSNPLNPVMGDRSFSIDSEIVSHMVKPFIQGLQEAGVSSAIKHFPGHGDTITDPHSAETSVELSLEEIRNRELKPFFAGVSQGVTAVMTAHIKTPQIVESKDYPVTLSSFFISNILRSEMGFDGIVISDSFSMSAIKDYWLPEESAVKFIGAGGDIILRPSDMYRALIGLLQALEEGNITEERINESVFRILAVKYRFGFFSDQKEKSRYSKEQGEEIINNIKGLYENKIK
jgi:beta-N-acetylhexosaminidase